MTEQTEHPTSNPLPRTILRPDDFHHEMVQAGDLQMHVVVEGPEEAPLVVLLHGFPEFWYSWRYQIKALAAAGYRVVAPDQRGYNLTAKQPPYSIFSHTRDVTKLIHALGYEQATLVGHDWGGGVAWLTAAFHPRTIERLIVCNCPHPVAFYHSLRGLHLPQVLKSWYIFFFQMPQIPEWALSANHYASLIRALKSPQISDEELKYFVEAWSQPGALSAGIDWYRMMVREMRAVMLRNTTVHAPTRLIWGLPDPYLERTVAIESGRLCDGSFELVEVEGGGHFVQQEMPERVSQLILGALKGS